MQIQRHLRIFISSTFQDMEKEREILLKNTFLELKKIAKSRDVEVTEIDLRTGVTKEQAENGQIVKICLDEVERCADSPIFFLGILGNRYGSVDWLGDVGDNILKDKKYSWITDFSNRSLTEIEIISALERNKKHNRAFIYLKDGEDDNEKLTNLKNRLIAKSKNNSHIEVTHYKDSSDFRIQTIESFTKALDELYPKDKKLSELDKLKNSHQIFAKSRQKVYISHAKNEMILNEFIDSDQNRLLLYGESGYGKSALIANYFKKFKQDNDLFIIEHYIGGAGELSNDLHQMLRRIMLEIKEEFNLPQEVPTEPQKIIDEFAPWLYLVKRPTIIILDGYNQIEDELKEKLFYYIPEKLEKVKLIITSIKDDYPIDNKYKIEPLSKEEKQELIIDYLTHYGKEGMALKIYTHISTHPQTDNTLFLRTLLNEIRLLGNFDNIENDINNYLQAKDIVELFIKIFERLESDYRTNLAQEVLSLLYVSRDGLSEDNLMEIINQNSTQKLSRLEFSPLFLALEEHLINKNGLYGFFHDYIREAVKNRYLISLELINIERRKIADYFEKREIDIQRVRELPFHLFEMGDRDGLYSCLINIEFFVSVIKTDQYKSLKYVKYINEKYQIDKSLKDYLLSLNYDYENIHNINEVAIYLTYIYQKKDVALLLYKRALDIAEKTLENHLAQKNRVSLNISLFQLVIAQADNLAVLYQLMNNHQQALQIHQKTLKISEEYLGKKDLDTFKCYNNLGALYCYKKDFQNALSLFQKALSGKQEILGENHEDTATSYNSLAGCYYKMKKYDEAMPLFQKALNIRKATLGENNHNTVKSYDNLAWLYIETKNYDKALNLLKKSLKIRKTIFVDNNHSLVKNLYKIAECYNEIDEPIKAISFYKKALTVEKKTLSRSNDLILKISNNLAVTYQIIGSFDKAIPIFLDNLTLLNNKKDKNYIEIGRCYHNLGVCYYDNYESSKAYKYMTEAVKIRAKYLSFNHPDLLQSKQYLKDFEEEIQISRKKKQIKDFEFYIFNKIQNGHNIDFNNQQELQKYFYQFLSEET